MIKLLEVNKDVITLQLNNRDPVDKTGLILITGSTSNGLWNIFELIERQCHELTTIIHHYDNGELLLLEETIINKITNSVFLISYPEAFKTEFDQVLIARLLSRIVNNNNTIILISNSASIVRELNCLYMLSSTKKDTSGFKIKWGYEREDGLPFNKMYGLTVNPTDIIATELDKEGFILEESDTVIGNLNTRSNELYFCYIDEEEK